MLSMKSWVSLLLLLTCCYADIYLHNPRGSNNRLNENTANRRNGNRVFDSQNNNKGGYNIGDEGENAARNEAGQYLMKYVASSTSADTILSVEWTNQHGCGTTNNKANCNQVLQFMCQPTSVTGDKDRMREGTSTATQTYQNANKRETEAQFNGRKNRLNNDRVLHEGIEWYDKCTQRKRNAGLFVADQNPRDRAKNTRQNPGGTRRGLECPEERDYHPYWHPSPWIDIAVLAKNASYCEYYQKESFNVKPKHECIQKWRVPNTKDRHHSEHNNKEDCEEDDGRWLELHSFLEKAPSATTEAACNALSTSTGVPHKWAVPYDGWKNNYQEECLVALSEPECKAADFSRVNHLGNGVNLVMTTYDWALPYFPSKQEQRCVFRFRYNISTDDYDRYATDSDDNNKNVEEPLIENDPRVDIGADGSGLQLAINTAQFGRTFQDRSHVFEIYPRDSDIGDDDTVFNLNVRGKRGNIVQTFPAVEYDFVPTTLTISEDDIVDIQWTGSNTHNNQGGGDGQAGDDGEGKGGSDRNNILGLFDPNFNFPLDMDNSSSIFNGIKEIVKVKKGNANTAWTNKDVAVQMASSGYFTCLESSKCQGESVQSKAAIQGQLNNAPASYPGALLKFRPGTYYYMCTRNNNFTNRSQKGVLIVTEGKRKRK